MFERVKCSLTPPRLGGGCLSVHTLLAKNTTKSLWTMTPEHQMEGAIYHDACEVGACDVHKAILHSGTRGRLPKINAEKFIVFWVFFFHDFSGRAAEKKPKACTDFSISDFFFLYGLKIFRSFLIRKKFIAAVADTLLRGDRGGARRLIDWRLSTRFHPWKLIYPLRGRDICGFRFLGGGSMHLIAFEIFLMLSDFVH